MVKNKEKCGMGYAYTHINNSPIYYKLVNNKKYNDFLLNDKIVTESLNKNSN
jgi:hypothetical protein